MAQSGLTTDLTDQLMLAHGVGIAGWPKDGAL